MNPCILSCTFLCILAMITGSIQENQDAAFVNDWVLDDNMENQRIRQCCKAQNIRSNCLPMCRTNVTAKFVMQVVARNCFDQTKILLYCGSEGRDNSKCCRKEKTPEICQLFCEGRAPPVCQEGKYALPNLMTCLKFINVITKCYEANLTTDAQWERAHQFPEPPSCN